MVTNIERPVHYRFARSAKKITILSESIAEDPNVLIPRCSQELGLYYGACIMAYFALRTGMGA